MFGGLPLFLAVVVPVFGVGAEVTAETDACGSVGVDDGGIVEVGGGNGMKGSWNIGDVEGMKGSWNAAG
jgi:hypothetical protein